MGKIVEIDQGSEQWLEWRRAGIGGSDAPIIEEISPYRTPLQLYREKRGEPFYGDDDGNEFIFSRGHQVEGLIRKQFQDLVKTEIKPICMVHDEYEQLIVSLDGFDNRLGVLEAKLVGQETLREAREGNLPAHHYSQMQHQFAVTGADVGSWFGHDGKKNGVLLEVRRNDEYIKRLLHKELSFWERVRVGEAPPLSDRDYLVPEDESLLKELRDAKELLANAEEAYEKIKEHVVNAYGGHPRIAGAGLKLFRVERQGSLNLLKIPEIAKAAEALKKELPPEYIEKFRSKGSQSWTIRIEGK